MTIFSVSVMLLLAWGAFAFGAEYAWSYTPLLVFSVAAGLLGIRSGLQVRLSSLPIVLSLVVFLLAGALQLVPVPRNLLSTLRQDALRVDYEQLYAETTMQPPAERQHQALSIAPSRTLLGLAFWASFTVLLVGCTNGISSINPNALVQAIVVLGVVVAFIGIIQASIRSESLFGFWSHSRPGIPFAPFANENHFAGWMVMAISLAFGAFWHAAICAHSNLPKGRRNRALWLSTPQASKLMLVAFAVVVMALSIVITGSRSGLVGLATAVLVSSGLALRGRQSHSRGNVVVVLLALFLVVTAAWGGAERTIEHFEGASLDLAGRKGVWQDSWQIIKDHPWTGTGLNTFGIAMLHYQSGPRNERFVEAHNDYLQLAAEGGLLLGVPVVLALALFIREVWRRFHEGADDARTYWVRAGAVTGLGAIAVQEVFDFTLQMPGAAALFVVLAALAIHKPLYLRRASTDAATSA